MGPPPPHSRTARGTARIKQGSTGFQRIKQGYQRKKQGSDGKTGKPETIRKRRRRDDNIESKTVASFKCICCIIIPSLVPNNTLGVVNMKQIDCVKNVAVTGNVPASPSF